MKRKRLILAILCIGCSIVTYGQHKPSKTTAKKTTATATTTPKSSSMQTAVISNSIGMLPEFEKSGGKPFMDVLRERENTPNIQREDIPEDQLSPMLWAACGMTTPNNFTAIRTNPTIQIGVYVILENGLYRYETEQHELVSVRKGHYNQLLTSNDNFSSDAAVAFFFVFKSGESMDDGRLVSEVEAGINCGAIMQNIALYCTNIDFACQPIAFSDSHKTELLKLINMPEGVILHGLAIGRK